MIHSQRSQALPRTFLGGLDLGKKPNLKPMGSPVNPVICQRQLMNLLMGRRSGRSPITVSPGDSEKSARKLLPWILPLRPLPRLLMCRSIFRAWFRIICLCRIPAGLGLSLIFPFLGKISKRFTTNNVFMSGPLEMRRKKRRSLILRQKRYYATHFLSLKRGG